VPASSRRAREDHGLKILHGVEPRLLNELLEIGILRVNSAHEILAELGILRLIDVNTADDRRTGGYEREQIVVDGSETSYGKSGQQEADHSNVAHKNLFPRYVKAAGKFPLCIGAFVPARPFRADTKNSGDGAQNDAERNGKAVGKGRRRGNQEAKSYRQSRDAGTRKKEISSC